MGAGTGATTQWANGMAATFVKGTVIMADSSVPSGVGSGSQQLYIALQAAGASLQAYRDGTDAVGHAALAN